MTSILAMRMKAEFQIDRTQIFHTDIKFWNMPGGWASSNIGGFLFPVSRMGIVKQFSFLYPCCFSGGQPALLFIIF